MSIAKWIAGAGMIAIGAGCPAPSTPTSTDASVDSAKADLTPAVTCTTGKEQDEVLVKVQFVRQMPPGTSVGFDIDNYTALDGDGKTCGHASLMSPDGVKGIDNQLSGLIDQVDKLSNNALDPDIQGAINNGMLLIGVSIKHLEDPKNDDCVTVEFRHLSGTPTLGTDMILDPNQTFNTAPDVPISTAQGSVKDGVLTVTTPFDLAFPVRVLDAHFTITVHKTQLRFVLADDGTMTGVIGGSLVGQELITNLSMYAIGDSLKAALPSLIDSFSDQALNPMTGHCDQISVAMTFSAKPAFINP